MEDKEIIQMDDVDIVNLIKFKGYFNLNVCNIPRRTRNIFVKLFRSNQEFFVRNLYDLEIPSNGINTEEKKNMEEVFNILPELKNLNLLSICGSKRDYGKLQNLPKSLSNLKCLSYLNLKHNLFEEIPDVIFLLKQLERLDMSCCKLKCISNHIKDLTKLKELHLEKNKILNLPTEIQNLKVLERLNVSGNKISKIPDEILSLTNLKVLNVSENLLQGQLSNSLAKMELLEVIQCRHNKIDAISKDFINLLNLRWFDVSYNELTIIPIEVLSMKCIVTEGNPLGKNKSQEKSSTFSKVPIFIQDSDYCNIEVEVDVGAIFKIPSGIELHFPSGVCDKNFIMDISIKSGLQSSFGLYDTEQLLSDILTLSPNGKVFNKPLKISIPYNFKSRDAQAREIGIRCVSHLETGENNFEDLRTSAKNGIATCEVSHFSDFAVFSRLVETTTVLKRQEQLLYSPIHPETKLHFPKDCTSENTRIVMQILEVDENVVSNVVGHPLAAASNILIVRIFPPSAVFNKPVSVTMALPSHLIYNRSSSNKLRLLKTSVDSMDWADVSEDVSISQSATAVTFEVNSFSKLWLVTEIVCGVARRVYRRLLTYKVQFLAMQKSTAPTLVIAQCLRQEHTDDRVDQLRKSGYTGDDPVTPIYELMEGDHFICKIIGELQQRDSGIDTTDEIISGTFRSGYPPDKAGFSRFFIEPNKTGYDKKATGFVQFYAINKEFKDASKCNLEKFTKMDISTKNKRKHGDDCVITMEETNKKFENSSQTYVDNIPLVLEPEKGEEIILPSSNPQELDFSNPGAGLFMDIILRGLARDIGKEWRIIGTYLGIGHATLDRIEMDNSNNTLEQTFKVLKLWSRMHMSEEDCVEEFADAFDQAGRKDLSQKILKIHQDGQEAFFESVKKKKVG